jgi:hypothetical protein
MAPTRHCKSLTITFTFTFPFPLTVCSFRVILPVLTYFPTLTCEYNQIILRLVTPNKQRSFFKAPDYDPAVTEYTNENKQPSAINEAISAAVVDTKAVNFTGVAMVRDVPILPLSSSPF